MAMVGVLITVMLILVKVCQVALRHVLMLFAIILNSFNVMFGMKKPFIRKIMRCVITAFLKRQFDDNLKGL